MELDQYVVEYLKSGDPMLYGNRVNYYRDGGTIGIEFKYLKSNTASTGIVEYYFRDGKLWRDFDRKEEIVDAVLIGYLIARINNYLDTISFDIKNCDKVRGGLIELLKGK